MNLNDDVVYRCLRLGTLHQLHRGRSRSLVRHHDRLHRTPPCVESETARITAAAVAQVELSHSWREAHRLTECDALRAAGPRLVHSRDIGNDAARSLREHIAQLSL